ncbi:MAG: DUF6457 domain-containing protein [Sciscionella sp.]
MNTLDAWSRRVATELGLDPSPLDRNTVLDVAKNTAHDVVRPAAPLTTYLLGVAVGGGMALTDAAAQVNALAAAWAENQKGESG